MKLHRLVFYTFLFLIPVQTRILYKPDSAYINWYFDYHLAFFLYLSDIVLFSCFTAWFIFDPPKYEQLAKQKLFVLILGFLGLCLVTLFHVKRFDLGLYEAGKWLEFFLILLYIRLTFKDKSDFELGLVIMFVSAVFQAILGWLQFHMQHMIGWKFLGEYIASPGTAGLATLDTAAGKIIRAYGTFPHPNILAAFLVLGMIIGLYFVSHATTWKKYLTIAGVVLVLIGIFTTFSRITWIAAALAIIAFAAFFLWHKKKSLALTIFISIAVSCITVFALYPDVLKSRVGDSNSVSIEDRYFFNQLGWDMFSQFPIFGVGVGNYVVALQDLYQLEPWQHQPPHNIFIFIFAELGILGTGLFILILLEIFSKLKNITNDPLVFTLSVIGGLFLLMSQFDHYFVTIQQGRMMFAVVLGLMAALPNIYDFQKSD